MSSNYAVRKQKVAVKRLKKLMGQVVLYLDRTLLAKNLTNARNRTKEQGGGDMYRQEFDKFLLNFLKYT